MNSDFTIKDNKIYQNGEIFLSLTYSIDKILVLGDLIIILFKYTNDVGESNIMCYNLQKEFIWQIGEPFKIHALNYYTSIYLREEKLCAYNVNGVEVVLEPTTGEIINSALIR